MDLQLILRVIWRFRLLVGVGLVLAIGLAFLSYYKVSPGAEGGTFQPREAEEWESLSTLFVTSEGFPWGSIGQTEAPKPGDPTTTPNQLDPLHLTGLAALYVRLSTSDPVLNQMKREGPIDGKLSAFPVTSADNGPAAELPMVTLSAISATPERAEALAKRHVNSFVSYIEGEQKRAGIRGQQKVVVQVARQPQPATLLVARKKTRPMVVFVAVMIVVLGMAFTLENLRPRVRVVSSENLQPAVVEKPIVRAAPTAGNGAGNGNGTSQPRRTPPPPSRPTRSKSRRSA
jgi:hypothetical protein